MKKARIDSVQFGILSPSDVRTMSAVEVTEVVVNKSGIVYKNGVNDSAMGTTSGAMLCSTCGNNSILCPGHFGHIELVFPVFNVEFINQLSRVLQCVCFYCSRLLLPKDHPKYAELLGIRNKKKRLAAIAAICKKIHYCVDSVKDVKKVPDETFAACGGHQPLFERDDALVRATFDVSEAELESWRAGSAPTAGPHKVRQILEHIDSATVAVLGMDKTFACPASMMWQNLVVPPITMRPSRTKNNDTKIGGEDDLTLRLRGIVKCNKTLAALDLTAVQLAQYRYDGTTYTHLEALLAGDESATARCPATDAYIALQYAVASYQDNRYVTNLFDSNEYGKDRKSLRCRFAGTKAKKGRMRFTIFGKRQNFSARTVITPCSKIDLDEVGVPEFICKKLTYPERVTPYNIYQLSALVRNGPHVYPGANWLVTKSGEVRSLNFVDRYATQLECGQIVRRHLRDGDDVLINRQPSLHKYSVMAHRVRVMPGKTFRLHMAATTPYNADFDGDEMNLHVLMDPLTRAEGREILSIKHNMVKDTVPLVSFQQNVVAAAYLLTDPVRTMPRATAWQLLFQNKWADETRLPPATPYVSGYAVFSCCLPTTLYVRYDDVVIEAGVMVAGRLKKQSLNRGVLYRIWKDIGVETAYNFVNGMQRLLEYFLDTAGLSVGPSDCFAAVPTQLTQKVRTAATYADGFPEHLPSDTGRDAQVIEDNVCLVLDKARDVLGDYVLAQFRAAGRRNGLFEIIESGAKGNYTNIIQIAGLVGQQRNHLSMRVARLTHHHVPQSTVHGMVQRSFFRGLRALEYFNHLVGARVGLVDTAVKTSETGYSQRRIAKAMEELVVFSDRTVRNANQEIVQLVYGDDGFDSTTVEANQIRLLTLSTAALRTEYHHGANDAELAHLERLQAQLRTRVRKLGRWDATCLCPVNFKQLLHRARYRPTSHQPLAAPTVAGRVQQAWTAMVPTVVFATLKMEALFFDWLATKTVCGEFALHEDQFVWVLEQVERLLASQSVTPHESVGMKASQHCAEPLTQLTLNRFHKSGQFSHLVSGVTRMKEIINVISCPKTPSLTVVVQDDQVETLGQDLVAIWVVKLVTHWTVGHDSARHRAFCALWTRYDHEEPVRLTLHLDKAQAQANNVSPYDICVALRGHEWSKKMSDFDLVFSYSEYDADRWWVVCAFLPTDFVYELALTTLRKHCRRTNVDDRMVLSFIYERLVVPTLVRGIEGITDYYVADREFVAAGPDAVPVRERRSVVVTQGSNFEAVLCHPRVDAVRTISNNIREIEKSLGIDAACAAIEAEWQSVMVVNNAHVGLRHIKLIAENMCFRGIVCPMTYQGICREDTSVLKKASFEKSLDSFLAGATHGQKDVVRGTMDTICFNNTLNAGTGKVTLLPTSTTNAPAVTHKVGYIPYVPPSKSYVSKFLKPAVTRFGVFQHAKEPVKKRKCFTVLFAKPNTAFVPSSPRPAKRQRGHPPKTFEPWTP